MLLLLLSYNIQERKLMRKHGASSWLGCERFRRTRKEEKNRMNDVLPDVDVYFFSHFLSLSPQFFFSFFMPVYIQRTRAYLSVLFFFLLFFTCCVDVGTKKKKKKKKKENRDAFFFFFASCLHVNWLFLHYACNEG